MADDVSIAFKRSPDSRRQLRGIKRITPHPGYSNSKKINDVAILIVSTFMPTCGVILVCLFCMSVLLITIVFKFDYCHSLIVHSNILRHSDRFHYRITMPLITPIVPLVSYTCFHELFNWQCGQLIR